MRVSPRRHVLVSLREAIGIGQKEFAGAVQIGESTLQKIELGTYPLRPRTAERIATSTGVDINYLTRNDLSEPLINWRGQPYDKGDFEAAQGRQKSATGPKLDYRIFDYRGARFTVTATLLEIYYRARSAFLNQPHGWAQFHQFVHRQYRLMDEMIEAVEPEKTKTRLWERVRDEHEETTQKQRLLTIKADIDEILELLASLEEQQEPKAKGTKSGSLRTQPAKQQSSARRRVNVAPRARRVSSSPNSAKQ
jgi:transcriptional regulator with XRE-family HTH domain